MTEKKPLDGDGYIKKCEKDLDSFQKDLVKAIEAYEVEDDVDGLYLTMVIAIAFMKFKDNFS